MLTLYIRRHSPDCLARLAQKGIITRAQLRTHRGCRCPWYVHGTTDTGVKIRQRALHVYTHEDALDAVKKLNYVPPASSKEVTPAKVREKWLEELALEGASEGTLRKYTCVTTKLVEFARAKGLRLLTDLTPDHINELRTQWVANHISFHSHRNQLAILAGLFKFARRYGVTSNPVADVKKPRRKRNSEGHHDDIDDDTATLPLDVDGSDTNYRKLLAAIPPFLSNLARMRTTRIGAFWTRPVHLVALCELMYETGLRVSDAIRFRRDAMIVDDDGGTYTTVQRKTGDTVTVFPPVWLAQKLLALEEFSPGYIFFDGRDDWRGFIHSAVYRPLKEAGEKAGICGVRPHRFRDSFAVNCLNQGMLLEEVQRLLGHKSLQTTERYYAKYNVPSRKKHLRDRLLAARQMPVPVKVVSIAR